MSPSSPGFEFLQDIVQVSRGGLDTFGWVCMAIWSDFMQCTDVMHKMESTWWVMMKWVIWQFHWVGSDMLDQICRIQKVNKLFCNSTVSQLVVASWVTETAGVSTEQLVESTFPKTESVSLKRKVTPPPPVQLWHDLSSHHKVGDQWHCQLWP